MLRTQERNQQTIVAEVSCNYRDGELYSKDLGAIGERFEKVITINQARGYRLSSWNFSRVRTPSEGQDETYIPETLNETIIAVFEKVPAEVS